MAVLGVCCAALGAGTGVGICAVIVPPLAPAVARGLDHVVAIAVAAILAGVQGLAIISEESPADLDSLVRAVQVASPAFTQSSVLPVAWHTEQTWVWVPSPLDVQT